MTKQDSIRPSSKSQKFDKIKQDRAMEVTLTDREAEIIDELKDFSNVPKKERRLKFHEFLRVFESSSNREFEEIFSNFLLDVCFDIKLKPLLKKQFLLLNKNDVVQFIKKFIVEKDYSFQKYQFAKKYLFERNLCLDFVFESVPNESFEKYFGNLDKATLVELLSELGVIPTDADLVKTLSLEISKLPSILDRMNAEPVFPTEEIFNPAIIPMEQGIMHPIPKLSNHYSSIYDLCYRQFLLYRTEEFYNLRLDIQDTIARMMPKYNPDHDKYDKTVFGSWAPNGTLINQIQLEKVGPVRLTENVPSYILIDVNFAVDHFPVKFQEEWDSIKVGDILYLIAIDIPPELKVHVAQEEDFMGDFKSKFGIKYLRGCQIVELLDDQGNACEKLQGDSEQRTVRVMIDPHQYQQDVSSVSDIYEMFGTFNVLARRDVSSNYYKYLLETIRDAVQLTEPISEWVLPAILGSEDATDALYTNIEDPTLKIDFGYTFVDFDHLKKSFGKVLVF